MEQAAEAGNPAARTAMAEVETLIKARDEAKLKAAVAERKKSEAGAATVPLAFEEARRLRDGELASASTAEKRLAAHERHFAAARKLERKIQQEVDAGTRPLLDLDIARYWSLEAEVDLAKAQGKIPVTR